MSNIKNVIKNKGNLFSLGGAPKPLSENQNNNPKLQPEFEEQNKEKNIPEKPDPIKKENSPIKVETEKSIKNGTKNSTKTSTKDSAEDSTEIAAGRPIEEKSGSPTENPEKNAAFVFGGGVKPEKQQRAYYLLTNYIEEIETIDRFTKKSLGIDKSDLVCMAWELFRENAQLQFPDGTIVKAMDIITGQIPDSLNKYRKN